MGRKNYEKTLFFWGAMWNWVAALSFLGIGYFQKPMLSYLMNKIPDSLLWFGVTSMAIFVFGIGYYYISRDVERNRDIIKIGIIGKVAIFAFFLAYYLNGEMTLFALLLTVGDVLWSVLFIDVLRKMSKTYSTQSR